MEQAIRYSKKRAAILQAIQSTDTHPCASWVYQTLKPTHPDLSLGTVYRNLVFLRQQGMIKSVGVFNGQERFDSCTQPHSHFVCSRCDAILDLPGLDPSNTLDRTVSEQYGFTVQRHELIFFGICPQCMQYTPEIQTKKNQEETLP